jgi:hypothetical protein
MNEHFELEATIVDLIAVVAWLKIPDAMPTEQRAALIRLRSLATQLGMAVPTSNTEGRDD